MIALTLHPRLVHAVEKLREDGRVDAAGLRRKVIEIERLLRQGTPQATDNATALGAELRLATELLAADGLTGLGFPHPHPDVQAEFRGEVVTLEVTRLRGAARVGWFTADDVFRATGNPREAARSADPLHSELFAAKQIRKKIHRARRYPGPANVLVLYSESEMDVWAGPACRGAWRATSRVAERGSTIPFGVLLYVGGSRMNEREEIITTNAAADTAATRALIGAAWPQAREFYLPGPAASDPDWPPARRHRERDIHTRALLAASRAARTQRDA